MDWTELNNLRPRMKAAVSELGSRYRCVPGLLLTEADLQAALVSELAKVPGLAREYPSADPDILATSIHTEVPWFDEESHLRIRPDITLLQPGQLSLNRPLQKGIPFPSKGYHSVGSSILFELKLYRGKSGIREGSASVIRRDVEKLRRLQVKASRFGVTIVGFVVVFSRYDRCHGGFSKLCRDIAQMDDIELLYESARFERFVK